MRQRLGRREMAPPSAPAFVWQKRRRDEQKRLCRLFITELRPHGCSSPAKGTISVVSSTAAASALAVSDGHTGLRSWRWSCWLWGSWHSTDLLAGVRAHPRPSTPRQSFHRRCEGLRSDRRRSAYPLVQRRSTRLGVSRYRSSGPRPDLRQRRSPERPNDRRPSLGTNSHPELDAFRSLGGRGLRTVGSVVGGHDLIGDIRLPPLQNSSKKRRTSASFSTDIATSSGLGSRDPKRDRGSIAGQTCQAPTRPGGTLKLFSRVSRRLVRNETVAQRGVGGR